MNPPNVIDVLYNIENCRGLLLIIFGCNINLDRVTNMSPLSNALSTHIVTVLHKIAGVEVDHDKATSLANSLQDIVRHIPVVVRHCAGSAVREDDRGQGNVQDMAHGGGRHVGQVHHHAESVHLQHHV